MKRNYKAFACCTGLVLPLCTMIIFLGISLISFSQGDTWQQKQSLGNATTARYQAVSFTIGNKAYVGTGKDIARRNDFWEFDPVTNVWTQKASMPTNGRANATGFSIDNKGYIGLGDSNDFSSYKDFWEYDVTTNMWTRKADFPGGARTAAAGFSIGSKGYVGTGAENISLNNNYSKNDFWEFDPVNNVWTQKANFPGAIRYLATGFSIGGKGYIGLGKVFPCCGYSDFWEYDPATDIWLQKANFQGSARWGAASFVIGNKAFIGTGNKDDFISLNELWQFDPSANAWIKKANFAGTVREQAVGFSIGNKGYIGSGYQTSPVYSTKSDFWEYDSTTDAWTQKADFGVGPRINAAGFSIDGKGYVGTGYDGSLKKDFWQYDPATNQWLKKADFPGGERQMATGFSLGNKGYLGQGFLRGRFDFVNDFWKYDPTTNLWISGTVPARTGRAAASTFTIGDKIYFGQGYDYYFAHHDMWQFDTVTGWTQKADFPEYGVAFSIGNKGYLWGNNFWEYDAATNTWTQRVKPAGVDLSGNAFVIKNSIYVLNSQNELWEYNLVNNTWIHRANFPGPVRQGATSFTIGNYGYFGFGSANGELKNDFWQYTPMLDNSITTTVTPNTFCSGTTITVSFDAKGTFDANNIFTVQLSDMDGNFTQSKIMATDTSVTSGILNIKVPDSLPSGNAYRIRVIASNPAFTGSDNGVNLTINPPPVAMAKNLTVYLNESGIAVVNPQQADSGSVAYCSPLKFALDNTSFNCGNIGTNKFILTVTDVNGNKAMDTALITVLDSLKPMISDAIAIPNTLWPPNHKMRSVAILYNEKDNCSIAGSTLSVTSNEAPTGSEPDWIIPDEHHLLLRAEMNDRRDKERIYYITITVKDSSGNTTAEVIKVIVAHDHGSVPEPGNCLKVSAIPNPSRQYFTLIFQSNNVQPVIVKVSDIFGRIIETRTVAANGALHIGNDYKPGNYYVQITQGKDHVILHLVKQSG